jgi:hypothetical protein
MFYGMNINAQSNNIQAIQIKMGTSFIHEGITIQFEDVITDSRCPKDVTCIWAGEVVVLISIFKNKKKIEQKKLALSPSGQRQDFLGNVYSSEAFKITGFNVLPYPNTKEPINKKEYCLEIQVN